MRGVELNDRLMGVARDGVAAAVAAPQPATGRHASAAAAALVTHLAAQSPPTQDDALWVALAPPADGAALGELLRQLRAGGYAVQGFVDRAALLAAWLGGSSPLVALDLSRQQLSISVAGVAGDQAALRRNVALPGGERALHDAWLQLAAATLVQQTRFDPLHDQRHEAQLRAQLPALAASAQREGQASCSIDTGADTLSLTLTRDQLASAAAHWLQPVIAALQALSAASDDASLLVPASLLDIPGLDDALAGARFARALRCDDGVAAVPASLLPAVATVAGAAGVPYRTQLARLPGAAPDVVQLLNLRGQEPEVMATHLVYRGRVLPIPAEGLVIGRDPGVAGALRLPDGLAGLSRRHCTLRRDGGRTQLIDHSSHGTWLDGLRVRGRALLAAGSTLRLGEPGIELALVALE